MADTIGMTDIRGENIARAVTGFALKMFKIRQVCAVSPSSNWTESYYQETATELTAGANRDIGQVARGASFPYVEPSWTKVSGVQRKYAAEGMVFVEDKLCDNIDVQERTLIRISRAIASDIDTHIYTTLSATTGILTAAAVATWDNATVADRDPIRDILTGIAAIDAYYYDVQENGYLLLSPTDWKNLLMNAKVINNPSFKTADVVSNGKVGQICGLTIIKSTSVTADEAMIIKGNVAAVWKTVEALTTAVIEDKGIKFTIRAWEIGQLQVPNPKAIYKITNTQA